jgi:diguanylate cyclase (GGDEF)-like protein
MLDHSNEPDLRILAILHRLERPTLAVVALVAGCVLALWLVPDLRPADMTSWSRMVPTTALSLLAIVATLVLSEPGRSPAAAKTSRLIAYGAGGFGAAVFVAHAIGFVQPANPWLRAPEPTTAAAIVLLGVVCANIKERAGRPSQLVDLCVILLIGHLLLLLAGYVFFVDAFVDVNKSNLTAPHTLFCLALLTFVAAARRAEEGQVLSVLVGKGIGSHMTRLVLPAVTLMPFVVFAGIAYLDRNGVISASHLLPIAASLATLAIGGVVAWMGKYTNGLERELRRQSLTDELTGILNRRGFYAVAEYALRNAARSKDDLLLFYFDLDKLKQANDQFGHEVGSLLIRRFAHVLSETFRKSDIIGRIGGDEFVVLAVGEAAQVPDQLARLQERVADDNLSGSLPVGIAYSTGYLVVPATAEASIDQLSAQADAIMYEQKRLKRQAA